MSQYSFIPSVNYHLWEPCNMRCAFCFATFQDVKNSILPKHLPKQEAISVVQEIAAYGFQKITFVGGEPTLCPWLSELIYTAKKAGMVTTIVTNDTRLTDAFLNQNKNHLDWIAISVDSLLETTNIKTGRAVIGKKVLSQEAYLSLAIKVKSMGFKLKINTVVNRENFKEDLRMFLKVVQPKRWKVLQVLPIIGQNDDKISEEQFQYFLNTHKDIPFLVPENNTAVKGSYVMLDPAGRLFDNFNGKHQYSSNS